MNNTLDLVRFVTILIRYAAKELPSDIRIAGSTHKPSKRHEPSDLLAYVRLGGTRIINDNVYCGMLRHTIIIDLYGPKTNPRNVEEVFELKNVITKEFPRWGDYMRKAGTDFKNRLYDDDYCERKRKGKEKEKISCGTDHLDDLKSRVRYMAGPFDSDGNSRERFEALINFNDDIDFDSKKGNENIVYIEQQTKKLLETGYIEQQVDKMAKELMMQESEKDPPNNLTLEEAKMKLYEDKKNAASMEVPSRTITLEEAEKEVKNSIEEDAPDQVRENIYNESGPYELASSFLENSGLYSMENFSGAGIELSFEVDEKVVET